MAPWTAATPHTCLCRPPSSGPRRRFSGNRRRGGLPRYRPRPAPSSGSKSFVGARVGRIEHFGFTCRLHVVPMRRSSHCCDCPECADLLGDFDRDGLHRAAGPGLGSCNDPRSCGCSIRLLRFRRRVGLVGRDLRRGGDSTPDVHSRWSGQCSCLDLRLGSSSEMAPVAMRTSPPPPPSSATPPGSPPGAERVT